MKNHIINKLKSEQIFMLATSIICAICLIGTFILFSEQTPRLVISAVLVLIIVLSTRVATPIEALRLRAARFAVWIFGGVLAIIASGHQLIDKLLVETINTIFPANKIGVGDLDVLSPSVLTAVSTVIMFVYYIRSLKLSVILGNGYINTTNADNNYSERRAAFVAVLKSNIERVDEDLRWHHRDFVSLSAEVDVRNTDHARRSLDLLTLHLAAYLSIFLIPFFSMYEYLKINGILFFFQGMSPRRLIASAISSIVALSLYVVSIYYFGVYTYLIILPAIIIVSVVIARYVWVTLQKQRRDRRRLKSATSKFNPSRVLIAESFSLFETDEARIRYLDWLEPWAMAPNNLAILGNIAGNPWPGHRRPNIEESEASTRLAQLDARWLGLDV